MKLAFNLWSHNDTCYSDSHSAREQIIIAFLLVVNVFWGKFLDMPVSLLPFSFGLHLFRFHHILLHDVSPVFFPEKSWLDIPLRTTVQLKHLENLFEIMLYFSCFNPMTSTTSVITLPWPQSITTEDEMWPPATFEPLHCHNAIQRIYNICQIQPFLTRDSALVFVQALVISSLDPLSAQHLVLCNSPITSQSTLLKLL